MHAGDLLLDVQRSKRAEIVGLWDSSAERMEAVAHDLSLDAVARYTDADRLAVDVQPEIVIVCSATRDHARWTEYAAENGAHVLLEKPFATSLGEADRMIAATTSAGVTLAVDWPLAWYPVHRTSKRLLAEGVIGEPIEVHYYDGNRGPLFHTHGKRVVDVEANAKLKGDSWWYRAASGGGSLLDYLGYGATLATWFRDGELPREITARAHLSAGDEVDEQAVVIAAYRNGLSTFQTRWGTFTDPWDHQPYPHCGFIVVGTEGTIASFDYADHVSVQTLERPEGYAIPVDVLAERDTCAVANLIDALDSGTALDGPISPLTSRAAQRIVDAAVVSVRDKTTITLDPESGDTN
jgi:glucose-fructose oxidoreductase